MGGRTPAEQGSAALGEIYGRIAALRKTPLNSISSELVKSSTTVVVEDLHVAGMLRNRKLAQHTSDAGVRGAPMPT